MSPALARLPGAALVLLAAGCASAQAAGPGIAATAFVGCHHVVLTRPQPERTVEFFVQLATQPSIEAPGTFVVRENRSSGFARLFRRARWSSDRSRVLTLVLSDGAEAWTATLRGAPGKLRGSASYSGDEGATGRQWRALATRYACRR